MEFLDAAIALAVTLAALATTVIIIMAVVVSAFDFKRQRQIEFSTKFYETSSNCRFKGDARYPNFVKEILDNSLRGDRTQHEWAEGIDDNSAGGRVTSLGLLRLFGKKSLRVYDWASIEQRWAV